MSLGTGVVLFVIVYAGLLFAFRAWLTGKVKDHDQDH